MSCWFELNLKNLPLSCLFPFIPSTLCRAPRPLSASGRDATTDMLDSWFSDLWKLYLNCSKNIVFAAFQLNFLLVQQTYVQKAVVLSTWAAVNFLQTWKRQFQYKSFLPRWWPIWVELRSWNTGQQLFTPGRGCWRLENAEKSQREEASEKEQREEEKWGCYRWYGEEVQKKRFCTFEVGTSKSIFSVAVLLNLKNMACLYFMQKFQQVRISVSYYIHFSKLTLQQWVMAYWIWMQPWRQLR